MRDNHGIPVLQHAVTIQREDAGAYIFEYEFETPFRFLALMTHVALGPERIAHADDQAVDVRRKSADFVAAVSGRQHDLLTAVHPEPVQIIRQLLDRACDHIEHDPGDGHHHHDQLHAENEAMWRE
jgi:hypothetical protein